MIIDEWLQVICTSMMGIMAGVYSIFSNTVMSTLKEVENGAVVMVKINEIILNITFKLTFFFSAICSVYLGIFANDIDFAYQFGCLVFFVGTFLVTLFKNIPLNNRLKQAVDTRCSVRETWDTYIISWVKWNHVRSVSAILSVILASISSIS